jgi:hypothetical protein
MDNVFTPEEWDELGSRGVRFTDAGEPMRVDTALGILTIRAMNYGVEDMVHLSEPAAIRKLIAAAMKLLADRGEPLATRAELEDALVYGPSAELVEALGHLLPPAV